MSEYMIPSYAKSYNIGHRALVQYFDSIVENETWVVEEKIDGSQFSFSRRGDDFFFRSKNKPFPSDVPEKMFSFGVEKVLELGTELRDGWVYRGEYLRSPKHGALSYKSIPSKHVVIFDVEDEHGRLLSTERRTDEAERLGFTAVRIISRFNSAPSEMLPVLNGWLEEESQLGGPKVEGVVIKRTERLLFDDQTSKLMIAKYVSETFREDQKKAWKQDNPGRNDVVQRLILEYQSKARLEKSIQRLKDSGDWDGSPKDIGPLMKLFPDDLLEDHKEDIKDALFTHFWSHIRRGVVAPIPRWYKEWLVENGTKG